MGPMRDARKALLPTVLSTAALLLHAAVGFSPPGVHPSVHAEQSKNLPPEGSPELLRNIEINFPDQPEVAADPTVYERILKLVELTAHVSLPSRDRWIPYVGVEAIILQDGQHLWDSGLFRHVWIDTREDPYPNGVPAKRVVLRFVLLEEGQAEPTGPPAPAPDYEQPPEGHQRVYPPR